MRQLAIGEVAERARMSTSRIRYYEARGLLPEPERVAVLPLREHTGPATGRAESRATATA